MNGTAAFYYPKTTAEPLIICTARSTGAGIEVAPMVAIDDDSTAFRRAPSYQFFKASVRIMLTKDLKIQEAREYRCTLVDDYLGDPAGEIVGMTGNIKFNHPSFVKLPLFWRASAEKIEAELRAAYRLSVVDNPAFEWLRKNFLPAGEVFLQTIYLANKASMTELTQQEREQAYFDSLGSAARHLRWS